MVQALVEGGAKVEVKGQWTYIIRETPTPLFMAIDNQHEDIALYLIGKGADPNLLCDSSHSTALTQACLLDQHPVIEALPAHGAQSNGISSPGCTGIDSFYFPLGRVRSAMAVEALVKAGADVNATNENGETALHGLVAVGQAELETRLGPAMLEAIRALLAYGADPQAMDNSRRTPLQNAKSPVVTQLLLAARAEPHPSARMSDEPGEREGWQNPYRRFVTKLAGLLAGRDIAEPVADSSLGAELYAAAWDIDTPERLDSFLVLLRAAGPRDVLWVSLDSYDDNETILHRLLESIPCHADEGAPPVAAFLEAVGILIEKGADLGAVETLWGGTPLHELLRASQRGPISPDNEGRLQ